MNDPLDEAIARAERLLESRWLLDDEEEMEFLLNAVWYDREVQARARERVTVIG